MHNKLYILIKFNMFIILKRSQLTDFGKQLDNAILLYIWKLKFHYNVLYKNFKQNNIDYQQFYVKIKMNIFNQINTLNKQFKILMRNKKIIDGACEKSRKTFCSFSYYTYILNQIL